MNTGIVGVPTAAQAVITDTLIPSAALLTATPGPGPHHQQRKVVAARNTVYGVPFLDQSSR